MGEFAEEPKRRLPSTEKESAMLVAAPRFVREALQSPGQSLNAENLEFMERRFGHSFAEVRVHTDAGANDSARALHALAYTVGSDIVFAGGRYAPNTSSGQRLLAHELTHVVQQRNPGKKGISKATRLLVSNPGDVLEREAEAVADLVVGRTKVGIRPSNRPSESVMRQDDSDVDGNQYDPGSTGDQGSEDYQVIDVEEDIRSVPDDDLEVQSSPDPSSGPIQIQRQLDIPPPPPPFPTGPQMVNDINNTVLPFILTCHDRRERGFIIYWDETTNKSTAGEQSKGDATTDCSQRPDVQVVGPGDRGHVYAVGFFHTHPPAAPGCRLTAVGPSSKDLDTSKKSGLPGIVRDFSSPSATCATEPTGKNYFFGPNVRDHY